MHQTKLYLMVARVAGEGRFFAQKHPQYRAGSAAANEVDHRPAFVVADGQEKPIDRRKKHPIGDRNAHGLLVRGDVDACPVMVPLEAVQE